MRFKRIDRLLDLLEEFKNISDMAAGAYIRQVNHMIANSPANNGKDGNNGRYTKSSDKPYGLRNRKSN